LKHRSYDNILGYLFPFLMTIECFKLDIRADCFYAAIIFAENIHETSCKYLQQGDFV